MAAVPTDALHVTPSAYAALAAVRKGVRALYGDRLAGLVLYGSQARGEATEDSDIDVLVLLEGPVDWMEELRTLSHLVGPVIEQHGELVSLKAYAAGDYAAGRTPFLRAVREDAIDLLGEALAA